MDLDGRSVVVGVVLASFAIGIAYGVGLVMFTVWNARQRSKR